jgi:hypothetical protein
MRKECEQLIKDWELEMGLYNRDIKFSTVKPVCGACCLDTFILGTSGQPEDALMGPMAIFSYKYSLNIHGQNSSQLFCFFCPVNFSKMANSTIFFTVGLLLAIIAFNEFQTAQADPSELPSLKVKM